MTRFVPKVRTQARRGALLVTGLCVGLGAGLGAGLGVGPLSVGTAAAQPIENELKYLIDSHPKIRESEKTLESRRASISEAEAGYYPSVSVTGEIGPEVIDSPTTRGRGERDPSRGVINTVNLTVIQNLFDGYSTTSLVRAAEVNREVAQYSLEGTRQSTLFEGVRAYIDVLRQRRLVEIARENERTILRQLNLEDERVRRGSGVTQDVLQAKSRLQIAKERRVGYEGALSIAISIYEHVFGHSPALPPMIAPSPPAEVIPSSLARVSDVALIANPSLIGQDATVEFARAQSRGAASE